MARLHDDELTVVDAVVRGLVDAPFPAWAALPLRPVHRAGTVTAVFRLGEESTVKLGRTR